MATGIMFPKNVLDGSCSSWAVFYPYKIEFFYWIDATQGKVESFEVDCDVQEVYRRLEAGRENIIYRTLKLHVDYLACSYSGGIDYVLPGNQRFVTFTLILGDHRKNYDILIADFLAVMKELFK